mmetsp:Transcript_39011/g.58409  ORF Transcript_39011/g.58409 Transcript_39011/m.58409 type:complete len:82 (-) Transcript_39011:738-983(-)
MRKTKNVLVLVPQATAAWEGVFDNKARYIGLCATTIAQVMPRVWFTRMSLLRQMGIRPADDYASKHGTWPRLEQALLLHLL